MTEIPSRWSDFRWPEWVPGRISRAIEFEWREAVDRSPRLYFANAEDLGAPPLGDRVDLPRLRVPGRAAGRFVHLAGRRGYVVDENGTGCEVLVPASYKREAASVDAAEDPKTPATPAGSAPIAEDGETENDRTEDPTC